MSTRPYIEAGDAATAAERLPVVGERWTCSTERGTRTVTVTSVWEAKGGHTAVAFEWHDDKPGIAGSALRLPVFLGTYKPPAPAPLLSDAERSFLAFALDCAADELSLGRGYSADDLASLAALRKLAGGAGS